MKKSEGRHIAEVLSMTDSSPFSTQVRKEKLEFPSMAVQRPELQSAFPAKFAQTEEN
jgi:hypothetical protein